MARAGVNYQDISKAAESIKAHGQEPTVDRVREHLGTGSKSTIAPLLKRWRSDHGEASDIGGLPNDLVEVVKSLHERLQQAANLRTEEARQEFKASSDELQKKLEEAGNTIAQMTTRNQDLEKEIERLTEVKKLQSRSMEDARVNLAKAESQRDQAVAGVTDLKEAVAELKQENRDIRNHFEHYQLRTAEDRQQEREQFRQQNLQLQDQLIASKEQLTRAEEDASMLLENRNHLQKCNHQYEISNASLKSELGRKAEEAKTLSRELDAALMTGQKFKERHEKLAEQLEGLSHQKACNDKEVAVLSHLLAATKDELESAKDKVAFLTDENKIILQEKAVIQGQFKQLQGSI